MPCLWTCEPEWETPLCEELARCCVTAPPEIVSPGWVRASAVETSLVEPNIAFASQCLPDAVELEASSISTWARSISDRLIEQLQTHEEPWRLHLFSHFPPGDPSGSRRAELIRAAVVDDLRRRQRRLLRSLTAHDNLPWHSQELLIQVGLRNSTQGVLSIATAEQRTRLRRVVSRWPAGVVAIPEDRLAPSRAYRKLAEVQLRLDRAIGAEEHCIDLGSSPGSWAWLALRQGARVTAIDRSPLREDLMLHPRLRFVEGDAFRFVPEEPVDWLLSDVIAFPARSIDLLHHWLSHRWCRQFCVTIKFRGQEDYPLLEQCKTMLSPLGAEFCLRRLSHNRNEVTAYGYAAGVAAPHPQLC